jgi:hypothetical protein
MSLMMMRGASHFSMLSMRQMFYVQSFRSSNPSMGLLVHQGRRDFSLKMRKVNALATVRRSTPAHAERA